MRQLPVVLADVFGNDDDRNGTIRRYRNGTFVLHCGYKVIHLSPAQRQLVRAYLVRVDAVASGETVTPLMDGAL